MTGSLVRERFLRITQAHPQPWGIFGGPETVLESWVQASRFYHNSFLPPCLWGLHNEETTVGETPRRTGMVVVAVLLLETSWDHTNLGCFSHYFLWTSGLLGNNRNLLAWGWSRVSVSIFLALHSEMTPPPSPRGGGSGVSPESLLLNWRMYPSGCWQCSLVLVLCSVTFWELPTVELLSHPKQCALPGCSLYSTTGQWAVGIWPLFPHPDLKQLGRATPALELPMGLAERVYMPVQLFPQPWPHVQLPTGLAPYSTGLHELPMCCSYFRVTWPQTQPFEVQAWRLEELERSFCRLI